LNRSRYLARTLATFTAPDSPLRDHDILGLDNASADDTREVVARLQAAFPRIPLPQRGLRSPAAAAGV